MLQPFEFVWTLRSSVWAVFNNFLFIDATDRSEISMSVVTIEYFSTKAIYSYIFREHSILKVLIKKILYR